jgi:translocation and assembly module TamB
MATKRSRKNSSTNEEDELLPEPLEKSRRRRSSSGRRFFGTRWLVRLGLLGLFAAVIVWFLPAIVANTPLKQMAIDMALSKMRGKATVESMELGWFSPVRLNGVRLTDTGGKEIVAVKSVELDRSLLGLINTANYGTITINDPAIDLVVRRDGSNLEDAILPLLEGPENPDSRPAKFEIVVNNGITKITDASLGQSCLIEGITARVTAPSANKSAIGIAAQGTAGVFNAGEKDLKGQFTLAMEVDPNSEKPTFSAGTIDFEGKGLPVDVASPFVSRFVEAMSIAGRLEGKTTLAWNNGGKDISINASPVAISGGSVQAPAWFGRDTIQIRDGWLQGAVAVTPAGIESRDLVCRTEFASLKANGALGWEQLSNITSGAIPGSDLNAEGSIDLARLAAMMPDTIPLHDDLTLKSGTLNFAADSRIDGPDRRLALNVESTGLSAVRAGQPIQWDKPVRIVATVLQGQAGTRIESLDCRTSFLTLTGRTDGSSGNFETKGDLRDALAEASRFVDLGDIQLAGKLDGQFAWQFDGAATDDITTRPLRIGGKFRIDQPLVNIPGKTQWTQPEINVIVQAAGQMVPAAEGNNAVRIDTGRIELVNSQQNVEAELVRPVINPSLSTPAEFDCKIGGDIETWLAQLRTLFPIDAAATGNIDGTTRLVLNGNQVALQDCKLVLNEFDFRGYGLTIVEPQVDADARVMLDLGRGSIEIPELVLRSSAIAARGERLLLQPVQGGSSLTGSVAFRADVNRTMSWFGAPAADAVQFFGAAEGQVDLASTADSLGGNIDIRVADLVAARQVPPAATGGVQNVSTGQPSWVRLLEEKNVTLRTSLRSDPQLRVVSFDQLQLRSSAFALDAQGNISDPAGARVADIAGKWNPDWKLLEPLVRAYTGTAVTFNEVTGGDFVLKGPLPGNVSGGTGLVSPDLQVQTQAAFASGTMFGIPMGGSRIQVQLAGGVAQVQAEPISFSGGQIRVSPSLDLRGENPVLIVPPGRIVDAVEFTPEVCRNWIHYVAPIVADATSATGKFSIETEGFQVPLNAFDRATIRGSIVMHGANVGPGPLGQQLVTITGQLKSLARGVSLESLMQNPAAASNRSWVVIPEQTVPFAMQEGRIHHQNLVFQIDDVQLRTQGSVGLDQTIQLLTEVPILDKWIGDNQWLAGLKGQMLQLPVSGPVSQPRIDNSVVMRLGQQMFQSAASGAINQQLQGLMNQGGQKLEQEIFGGLKGLLDGKKQ